MKVLFIFFMILISSIVKANEFNYGLKHSIGLGIAEERQFPHYRYNSEVVGLVHFFNNYKIKEPMSVNLLGLGIGYNSKSEVVFLISPLSMNYNNLSISYNLHLEKLNYGFSFNYQF